VLLLLLVIVIEKRRAGVRLRARARKGGFIWRFPIRRARSRFRIALLGRVLASWASESGLYCLCEWKSSGALAIGARNPGSRRW